MQFVIQFELASPEQLLFFSVKIQEKDELRTRMLIACLRSDTRFAALEKRKHSAWATALGQFGFGPSGGGKKRNKRQLSFRPAFAREQLI